MQYESTIIYGRAMELIRLCGEVLSELPVGYGFLADQLRRASSSVVLNFAEGYGKESTRDARRYFVSARGSANEVAAILDVGEAFGVVTARRKEAGRQLCDELTRMLSCFRRYRQR